MGRTLILGVLSLIVSLGNAQNGVPAFVKLSDGMTTSTAMSPDGRYAVGQKNTLGEAGVFTSYLWDADNGQLTWMTELDESDFDASGYFADVNNAKTIVGHFKDKNYLYTFDDGIDRITAPICVAAIWKNGEKTSLGIGDFTMNDFESHSDGTYATAVSADSKTIVGFVNQGNSAYFTPCGWKFNETSKTWDFERYAVPSDAKGGQIGSISADGKLAVGYIAYQFKAVPVVWTSPKEYTVIQLAKEDAEYDKEWNFNYAYKISQNGEYVLFALNNLTPCVYNVKERTYVKLITYPDITGLSARAISDQGDVVGAFKYGGYMGGEYTRPFWYSYKDNKCTDFDYFIQTYAAGVDIPFSFDFLDKVMSVPQSISADGTIVFGTNDGGSWMLHTVSERITLPECVTNIKAVNNSLKVVTISWDKVKTVPSGLSLKSYKVFCDGVLLQNIEVDSKQENGDREQYIHQNVAVGTHSYSVAGVYASVNGDMFESPKATEVIVPVVETFNLPLFDDFESNDFLLNGWNNELQEGDVLHNLKWIYHKSNDENQTTSATNIVVTDKPYSATLTSRFMDATNMDNVYVSFYKRLQYANRDDWDFSVDTLSLEFSTDEIDWIVVKDYPADEVEAGLWNFEQLDLTDLAANRWFKLRLRTHGQARAQLIWFVDVFKVGFNAEKKKAPEGLVGSVENGKVKLLWKNSINAYELSYLENSNALYELCVGSEGVPLIVASAYDPEQLKYYDGKYITSVTTFLYDSPYIETDKPTHASILIYVDEQLVYEQEIENIINDKTFAVKLDKPIKIDSSKSLKVAMKIFDYDPQQTPIYYQCTKRFVPGKSDLYSEDEGKTWKKLSDLYVGNPDQEEWGYCCWPMRANITDEAILEEDPTLDDKLMGYSVYRNGEQINAGMVYSPYMKFIDEQPVDNACYEVVAFYADGGVSDYSEQFCVGNVSGIENNNVANSFGIYPNPATDYVKINGEFDKATLFDVNGQSLMKTTERVITVSNLPSGIYILKIETGKKVETKKLVVKR